MATAIAPGPPITEATSKYHLSGLHRRCGRIGNDLRHLTLNNSLKERDYHRHVGVKIRMFLPVALEIAELCMRSNHPRVSIRTSTTCSSVSWLWLPGVVPILLQALALHVAEQSTTGLNRLRADLRSGCSFQYHDVLGPKRQRCRSGTGTGTCAGCKVSHATLETKVGTKH